jgi:predicted O-methyltransferase YrrM
MSVNSTDRNDGDRIIGRIHPEVAYARRMPDADSYQTWSGEVPLYAPWQDEANLCDDFGDVAILTLNPPEKLYYLAALSRHAAALGGAFAECGVFRGGTALLMARVTEAVGTELYLLDSFDGLPEPETDRDVFYRRGDFRFTDAETVVGMLAEAGPRVHLRAGWIPDTLADLPERAWSLVHVDVDLYRPTMSICEYFYDRLVPGGVMVFDEYGFPTCRGERDAVDAFFADRVESPVVLPTGQAFVIKLG